MKKFAIILVLLFAMTGCAEQQSANSPETIPPDTSVLESNPEIIPPETNMWDVITAKYTQAQLQDIVEFSGSMDEHNAIYPVERTRQIGTNCQVVYCSDQEIAVLLFDQDGNKYFSKIYPFSPVKDAFADLQPGTLRDVQEIDDYPVSTHYTIDGYEILIRYDDSLNIEEISINLI